ncbi:unnamed protein product [Soboliphyme baturini]|uniref:Uncharacterized protein n=1 Tax=Soboliphyme baturini TaxID=241478 RepID=A0A3P7ZE03_9BILA|nr:unnamed protein product [Soboliphyme baturini]
MIANDFPHELCFFSSQLYSWKTSTRNARIRHSERDRLSRRVVETANAPFFGDSHVSGYKANTEMIKNKERVVGCYSNGQIWDPGTVQVNSYSRPQQVVNFTKPFATGEYHRSVLLTQPIPNSYIPVPPRCGDIDGRTIGVGVVMKPACPGQFIEPPVLPWVQDSGQCQDSL